MGLTWIKTLFGFAPAIKETVEVFRSNAEADAQRAADSRSAALVQYGKEFGQAGIINQIADGLNRLGRPVLTYGVFALFASAMFSPSWFSERMTGLALVPEPLWIILGAIVTFFFGGREATKLRAYRLSKEAVRSAAAAVSEAPTTSAEDGETSIEPDEEDNPALRDWEEARDYR